MNADFLILMISQQLLVSLQSYSVSLIPNRHLLTDMQRTRQANSQKLRSLLPKVLLYDNISLAKQLDKTVINLGVEERKLSFNWTQLQKRFITKQALKEELQGLTLFPSILGTQGNRNKTFIVEPFDSHKDISDFVTQSQQVGKARLSCHAASDTSMERKATTGQRPEHRKTSDSLSYSGNPIKDSRFTDLHKMLSEVKELPSINRSSSLVAK